MLPERQIIQFLNMEYDKYNYIEFRIRGGIPEVHWEIGDWRAGDGCGWTTLDKIRLPHTSFNSYNGFKERIKMAIWFFSRTKII